MGTVAGAPKTEPQPRIFISYRRSDSSDRAHALYDALVKSFGADSVFMDVDTIEPGANFPRKLKRAIHQSDFVLVLVGPDWLDTRDDAGRARLGQRGDYVRREIRLALGSGDWVIPILMGGATVPARERLPRDLRDLTRLNFRPISDERWERDVDQFLDALRRLDRERIDVGLKPTPLVRRPATADLATLSAASAVIAALALPWWGLRGGGTTTGLEVQLIPAVAMLIAASILVAVALGHLIFGAPRWARLGALAFFGLSVGGGAVASLVHGSKLVGGLDSGLRVGPFLALAALAPAAIAGVLVTRDRRRPRTAGRRPGRVVVAGALLAAVVVGSATWAASGQPVDLLVEVNRSTGNVTHAFRVPASDDVAVGPGVVWIRGDHELVRFTPSDARLLGKPFPDDLTNVVVGFGSAWVGMGGGIAQVDSASGRVRWIPARADSVIALAVGEGSVWATATRYSDEGRDQQIVLRIDPRRLAVVTRSVFDYGEDRLDIAVGAGAVWLGREGTDTVYRLDPASLSPTESHTKVIGGNTLVVAGNALWVVRSGGATRVDPSATPPTNDIPFSAGSGAAGDAAALWVGTGRSIRSLDPGGGFDQRGRGYPMPISVDAIALTTTTVWVVGSV